MTDQATPDGRWLVILGAAAGLSALLPARAALLPAALALLLLLSWWILQTPQRWVRVLLVTTLLLPPLPFALGGTGPHPALLVAALGGMAGLIYLNRFRFALDFSGAALLLLWFVLLGSAGLAAIYSGAAVAAASLARILLFGISVYVYFYVRGLARSSSWRTAPLVFAAASISALFACVDFYYQLPAPAGFSPQFVWLDTGVYRRAQGVFYDAGMLGNFCAFFLVMSAVALTRPRRERPLALVWLIPGGALLAGALLFSYSRASIASLAVSLLALAVVRMRTTSPLRLTLGLGMALATAAAVGFQFLPALTRAYWERLWASAAYFFSFTEGVLSGRVESWSFLLGFLSDHPWHAIVGIGYKTLPYSDFVGRPVIADNMYLSMLVETGIVGLSAMLLLHAAILRAGYRAATHPDPKASFFGQWIFCFWVGQVVQMLSADVLTYWRVLPVYFWTLAVAVRLSDDHLVSRSIQ